MDTFSSDIRKIKSFNKDQLVQIIGPTNHGIGIVSRCHLGYIMYSLYFRNEIKEYDSCWLVGK